MPCAVKDKIKNKNAIHQVRKHEGSIYGATFFTQSFIKCTSGISNGGIFRSPLRRTGAKLSYPGAGAGTRPKACPGGGQLARRPGNHGRPGCWHGDPAAGVDPRSVLSGLLWRSVRNQLTIDLAGEFRPLEIEKYIYFFPQYFKRH